MSFWLTLYYAKTFENLMQLKKKDIEKKQGLAIIISTHIFA